MQVLNPDGTRLPEWEYKYTPKTPKNIYLEDFEEKPSLFQRLKSNWHRFNSFSKIVWQIKYLMFLITPIEKNHIEKKADPKNQLKKKIIKTKRDKAIWVLLNPHPNSVYLNNLIKTL